MAAIAWTEEEKALLAIAVTLYLAAFALFEFMLFALNRKLPLERRIPRRLHWGYWNRLQREYEGTWQGSLLYKADVALAALALVGSALFASVRMWRVLFH